MPREERIDLAFKNSSTFMLPHCAEKNIGLSHYFLMANTNLSENYSHELLAIIVPRLQRLEINFDIPYFDIVLGQVRSALQIFALKTLAEIEPPSGHQEIISLGRRGDDDSGGGVKTGQDNKIPDFILD